MAISITVRTGSGRPIGSTFKKLIRKIEKAAEKELKREGNEILSASLPLVPKKLGPLRASGRVDFFKRKNEMQMNVAFGGNGVDYAILRHNVEAQRYTTPGTQAFYLSQPWEGFKPGLPKRVAKGISRRIRGI